MNRFSVQDFRSLWSGNLAVMASADFFNAFGQGLLGGASMNFFVQTLGLSGGQVLWLEGIREIPGLALVLIAAFTMRFPLAYRGIAAVLIMGLGYILHGFTTSFWMLATFAIIASLGMHMWMPLHPSLAMCLTTKDRSGRMLGTLASVQALARIIGMGAVGLSSRAFPALPLNTYYFVGGSLIILAGLVLSRLPCKLGETRTPPPRMLVRRRYWLYYVLTFFEGSRKEVLGTFITLVLVQNFGLQVWHISLLLLTSASINLLASPVMGYLLDRFGERRMLSLSYVILAFCCLGYATIDTLWLLIPISLTIKTAVTLSMGLNTYVNRIAPREELTPTLSAGISINHVTSVAMPLIAGALLPLVGYDGIFFMTAAIILGSIPFALSLRVPRPAAMQTEAAAAD